MAVDPDRWIALFIGDNATKYHIVEDHWNELRAAYTNWIERKIDRVLELTAIDGDEVIIAASRISDFSRTTPEGRDRDRTQRAEIQKEAGIEGL